VKITVRLTVGQATVRFLAAQRSERDGVEHRLVEGCFGIFGHGNVAGIGQALLEAELAAPAGGPGPLPYRQARNEQGMVHAAAGFARMRNRMSTLACTTSIGPGATNMVTGAALATVNRLPVLLLPGDVFATRVANPVLQELEDPRGYDISEFSIKYASQLLRRGGVATERFQLGLADVRVPLPAKPGEFRWAVFAEIMEHIPDPLTSLRYLRACMAPGAPVFITTVMNSNAIDHLYLFTEADQVRAMLRDAGFAIQAERELRVADYSTAKDPSIDIVCVCTPT